VTDGNSTPKVLRPTETKKGCEVKRETLNLVVSPEIEKTGGHMPFQRPQATEAGTTKTRASLRRGVADSIEQHMEPRD